MRSPTIRKHIDPAIREDDQNIVLTLTVKISKSSGMTRVCGYPVGMDGDGWSWLSATTVAVQAIGMLAERYRRARKEDRP